MDRLNLRHCNQDRGLSGLCYEMAKNGVERGIFINLAGTLLSARHYNVILPR
jgi:hypothetical protein